jgi:site-specific DNA-cytosine methylase
LDLGLEAAGFETAWVCENDRQCQEIISARRPGLTVYPDVRKLAAMADVLEPVERVGRRVSMSGSFVCWERKGVGR